MRIKYVSKLILLVCLSVTMTVEPFAQEAVREVVAGEEIAIQSETLEEERSIFLRKPMDYSDSDQRYPVIIVLDGMNHFDYTSGLVRFLSRDLLIPEMLVVSIENTDRARDMTPPSENPFVMEQVPSHGGSADFLSFIGDELLPWLDANYRTLDYRILVGHSLGGLFAIESLITRPQLFNAYLAISPSLQWDSQNVVERAESFFEGEPELDTSLFMTVGNEGGPLANGVHRLVGVLEEKAPNGLDWHFEPMPRETHGTVPFRSTYQGLEFIFADWTLKDPFSVYDTYGIEAVEQFFEKSNAKYGMEDRGLPDHVGAAIGQRLRDTGRLDELMLLVERYRDTLRPPPQFLLQIATRYRDEGRTGRAIQVYRQVLDADPENETAQQALAELGEE